MSNVTFHRVDNKNSNKYFTMTVNMKHEDRAKLSPQSRTILRHLMQAGSISNVEAQALYRVRSLSRRITEIQQYLFNKCAFFCSSDMIRERKKDLTGQRYVRYSIGKSAVNGLRKTPSIRSMVGA